MKEVWAVRVERGGGRCGPSGFGTKLDPCVRAESASKSEFRPAQPSVPIAEKGSRVSLTGNITL